MMSLCVSVRHVRKLLKAFAPFDVQSYSVDLGKAGQNDIRDIMTPRLISTRSATAASFPSSHHDGLDTNNKRISKQGQSCLSDGRLLRGHSYGVSGGAVLSPTPSTPFHFEHHSQYCHHQISHRLFTTSLPTFQGLRKSHPAFLTKVLYDGDCDLCKIEISALKRFTRNRNTVQFVDISSDDYKPENHGGVSYEDAMKEMHVVGPDGKVHTQGDAIRQMYRACGLGWLASVTELSVLKPSLDRMYMRFAEYRLKKALHKCEEGACSMKLKNLRDQLKKS